MNIFVVYNTGHFGGVYFWRLEVIEKEKTYQVVKSEKYIGSGNFVESRSLSLLQRYPKKDPRVFHSFVDARDNAVRTVEMFIARQEEKLQEDKMKLRAWQS